MRNERIARDLDCYHTGLREGKEQRIGDLIAYVFIAVIAGVFVGYWIAGVVG